MTRIDFYILPDQGTQARQQFACRLLQKTARLGHRIYLNCLNEEQALAMDKLLWEFQPQRFLPHRLISAGGAECPVEIGHDMDPEQHDDLLINLAGTIPPYFSRFHRVTEIVTQDPETLKATRANYKFYKDRHYPLHNHDLRNR